MQIDHNFKNTIPISKLPTHIKSVIFALNIVLVSLDELDTDLGHCEEGMAMEKPSPPDWAIRHDYGARTFLLSLLDNCICKIFSCLNE